MSNSTKVSVLNFFRQVFKQKMLEKVLVSLTTDKAPDHFFSKLVPNPYQYPPQSIRQIQRKGISVQIDISDYIGHYLYFGFKDPGMEALFSLCKEGDNVIDVGVNIGWTVLNLAQRSLTGKVFGFEPDAFNFGLYSINKSLNSFSNIQVFNCGLGEENETVEMEVRTENNRGGNRILKGADNAIKVQVKRLSEIPEITTLTHIDLIKIDVEGYELRVLKGATDILVAFFPVLFIEVDEKNLNDQGDSAKDLILFLQNVGYAKIINADTRKAVTAVDNFEGCHFDIIATRS